MRKHDFLIMRKLGLISMAAVGWSLALSGALNQSACAEETRIGVVDMNRALQTVESGKKAKTTLEKEFNSRKKNIQAEETSIRKMGEEFKKQSLVLSDEARSKKQAEIQERIMKLQEMSQRAEAEFRQKERELTDPIVTKLRTIITDMAKSKGYTVILEKNDSTVLYIPEKDDLTNDLIGLYNKQVKS